MSVERQNGSFGNTPISPKAIEVGITTVFYERGEFEEKWNVMEKVQPDLCGFIRDMYRLRRLMMPIQDSMSAYFTGALIMATAISYDYSPNDRSTLVCADAIDACFQDLSSSRLEDREIQADSISAIAEAKDQLDMPEASIITAPVLGDAIEEDLVNKSALTAILNTIERKTQIGLAELLSCNTEVADRLKGLELNSQDGLVTGAFDVWLAFKAQVELSRIYQLLGLKAV